MLLLLLLLLFAPIESYVTHLCYVLRYILPEYKIIMGKSTFTYV